jgi:DNA-binding transcriptional regulator YiaG
MADMTMPSREFNYILRELGLSLTTLSELVGYGIHTVNLYSQGKSAIPTRMSRLLRVLLQHRDGDYLTRLLGAAQPLLIPDGAPLWVFGRGHRGHLAPADIASMLPDESALQRELRYIFAQLQVPQSAVAQSLGLTKTAVSSWFLVNASGPTGLVLRVLRVAVATPILAQMLSASPAMVPETFNGLPPVTQRGFLKSNAGHVADEPMTPREFFCILDRLQLTPAAFNSQSGYVTQYYLLSALKRPTLSFPHLLTRLLRLSFHEPSYFSQLSVMQTPLQLGESVNRQPLLSPMRQETAELRQIFTKLGMDLELLAAQLGLHVQTISNWFAVGGGRPSRLTLRVLRLATQTDVLARLNEPEWQRAIAVPADYVAQPDLKFGPPPMRTQRLLRPELEVILARLGLTVPQLCQRIGYEKPWQLERQVESGALSAVLARVLRAAYVRPELLAELASAAPCLPAEPSI